MTPARSCFLTGESTAEDDACPFERGRAAFVTVFLFHASLEGAAHKDDRDASGEGVPHAFVRRKGDVAAAESFGDDAGGSVVCCRAEDVRFCPCGAFHEPHRPGEAVGMNAGPADRAAAPEDPPAGDSSRGAPEGRLESGRRSGVGLLRVSRGKEEVIHGDEDSGAFCPVIGSGAHGGEKIGRTVGQTRRAWLP